MTATCHCMWLSDKDLVKKLLKSNQKIWLFGCLSITFLPALCLKDAKMDILLSFFQGICFKAHANLMSINGYIKESLTWIEGFWQVSSRFSTVIIVTVSIFSQSSGVIQLLLIGSWWGWQWVDLDYLSSSEANLTRSTQFSKKCKNIRKINVHCVLVGRLWYEPVHEISNNMVCATSKASDQPAQTRSLIRAFASRLSILWLLSYWLNTIWSF